MAIIQLQLSKNLYIRDPQETELGKKKNSRHGFPARISHKASGSYRIH